MAPAAVITPSTAPRRFTNQRLATVAPSTEAIEPAPSPTSTPQSRYSCQGACITVVSAEPEAIRRSAPIITARTPKRSIRAAANGPTSPKSTRLMETAKEIVAVDQPNSFSRGTISTPGVARNPAAPSRARKVTPATIQA